MKLIGNVIRNNKKSRIIYIYILRHMQFAIYNEKNLNKSLFEIILS